MKASVSDDSRLDVFPPAAECRCTYRRTISFLLSDCDRRFLGQRLCNIDKSDEYGPEYFTSRWRACEERTQLERQLFTWFNFNLFQPIYSD